MKVYFQGTVDVRITENLHIEVSFYNGTIQYNGKKYVEVFLSLYLGDKKLCGESVFFDYDKNPYEIAIEWFGSKEFFEKFESSLGCSSSIFKDCCDFGEELKEYKVKYCVWSDKDVVGKERVNFNFFCNGMSEEGNTVTLEEYGVRRVVKDIGHFGRTVCSMSMSELYKCAVDTIEVM